MPHFQYCSIIWHFCGARISDKLDLLDKHALRIILSDNVSTYEVLLEKLELIGLSKRRFQHMILLACLHYLSYIYFYCIYFSEILALTRYSLIRVEIKFASTTTTTVKLILKKWFLA